MQEKIVETKICKHCNSNFEITDTDLEFYEKVSPVFAGKKYNIPTPSLCPDCRHIRRLSFRNEFNYYKMKCDFCNKNIISVHYKENSKFPIYCQKCWWEESFKSTDYGREFDFDKTFFEQFKSLQDNVPKINMINDNGINSENSEYCYNFSYGKNNYLITTAWHAEESMYCQYGGYFKYNIDCNLIFNSEVAYECMGCGNINNCFYIQDSNDCDKCFLGIDLKGCSDCFGCIGLRNKKYYIFNKEYSKTEYETKIKEFLNGSYNELRSIKNDFYEFSLKFPHVATYQNNCTNSIGDRLNGCKNVYGNNIYNGENCKYYWGGADSPRTSYDILVGGDHDLGYESIVPDNTYQACFTNYCLKSKFVFYCDNCFDCSNIFGCIGLRNKSYCILNKQYTKEEYEELVSKIIEHMKINLEWGEFFPSNISPFGYNESVAMEYKAVSPHPNPLPRGEGIIRGTIKNNKFIPLPLGEARGGQEIFNWSNYEVPFPKADKIIIAGMLPDNIKDIPDDILNWAIECEVTKKPFKITLKELEFYRKHNLPVPRKYPYQRHLDRLSLRNTKKLYDRKCDKCGIEIKTTYGPERKEIVYCEECYNKEIY